MGTGIFLPDKRKHKALTVINTGVNSAVAKLPPPIKKDKRMIKNKSMNFDLFDFAKGYLRRQPIRNKDKEKIKL